MEVIIFDGFWSIDDVKSLPNYIFIFGDNDVKRGKRGQAIIRDEVNAMGIPTKKEPTNRITSFYKDTEYDDNIKKIDLAIDAILSEVKDKNYDGIVLPKDGFGTGLAKLNVYAPKTLEYIQSRIEELINSKR